MLNDARLPPRFWAKVKVAATGCWLWLGSCTEEGYGRIKLDRKVQATHRVVYRRLVGAIPSGYQIDHRCKVRHCCNPTHLDAVLPVVNVSRAANFNREKVYCKNGHEFNAANTRVRQPPDRTAPRRICIACLAVSSAVSYRGKVARAGK